MSEPDKNLYLRFATDAELALEMKRRGAFSFTFNEKIKDGIDVEHCFSGFMGYSHVIFIWSKDLLLQTLFVDDDQKCWVSRPGMKVKVSSELSVAEKFFEKLRKFLIHVMERL